MDKKKELQNEVDFYSEFLMLELENKVEQLKKALIIAGILSASFIVVKSLTTKNSEDAREKDTSPSFLSNVIKGILTTAVISFFKKEISIITAEQPSNEQ